MKLNTKSIATVLAILPMSLLSLTFGQNENLVENGSFESTTGKAKKLGAIDMATGWVSPTGVRADLFTPAAKVPDISTPTNIYGTEEPKEGKNYAGIVTFSYNDKVPRSYIMSKLATPLKKGMTYCVQFNASLAELSKYSSNQIGAHLSTKPFGTEEKSSIIEQTHVLQSDNKIFNAQFGWDKVCGTFVAKGGEKYITIGNFTNNDNTRNDKNKKPESVKGTVIIASYYYIDDVSVTLVETGQTCDCGGPAIEEEPVSNTVYQKSVVLNEKMTPTQKIETQATYFGYGKAQIQPAGMAALDVISNEMKSSSTLKIQVIGFSDAQEDLKGAEKPVFAEMDKKRTAAVVAYLKEKGIPESRMIIVNKGSSETNPEISAADQQDLKMAKNRRVIFKVVP